MAVVAVNPADMPHRRPPRRSPSADMALPLPTIAGGDSVNLCRPASPARLATLQRSLHLSAIPIGPGGLADSRLTKGCPRCACPRREVRCRRWIRAASGRCPGLAAAAWDHALRRHATKHCRYRRAAVSRFFAWRYSDGHYLAIVDAFPWRSFGLNGRCTGFVATAGRRAAT